MRLLIITHTFPPSAHSNAKRPFYIAKGALDAGWQVDVITSWLGVRPGQEEILQHEQLRILRRSDPVVGLLRRLATMPRVSGVLSRMINGTLWPDHWAIWAERIFRDRGSFEGYDRVLAFVFPPSVLLAGRHPGLVGAHWIFDLQESVTPQFKILPRRSPMQRMRTPALERLERATLHQAGRVVFTAESNRRAYIAAGLVPEAVTEHVPYFYDAPEFAGGGRVDAGFEIRYYGGFDLYGERNPETFLQSLVAFLERHPEARSETRFVFHGEWLANHDRYLAKAGLEGVVQIRSPLTYEEYLEGLVRSPVLLLVVAAAHNLFMPSKIVDYFGARRPILAFVPAGSEMRHVLEKAGMADYASDVDDVEGGVRALERLWGQYRVNRLELEGQRTEEWSSTIQLARYLGIVSSAGGVEPLTDMQALQRFLGVVDAGEGSMALVRRDLRKHLALPADRQAASHALRLYQPQRRLAKAMTLALRMVIPFGLHRLLPSVKIVPRRVAVEPPLPAVIPGSCGMMFGSPQHSVRRIIASFKTENGWEVAKVAFGPKGRELIRCEVAVLEGLPRATFGVPCLLGMHCGPDITLMRIPFVQGRDLRPDEWADALALLESWQLGLPAKPIHEFSEWQTIEAVLSGSEGGGAILAQLSQKRLTPVIRHGDFARWNILRRASGELFVLDWESGAGSGMPGVDLVHFFAQDARLVLRLSPPAVIEAVERSLHRRKCRRYLESTGWSGDVRALMLASIAFACASKSLANRPILMALLDRWGARITGGNEES